VAERVGAHWLLFSRPSLRSSINKPTAPRQPPVPLVWAVGEGMCVRATATLCSRPGRRS
jgi:hypothetical protein